MEKLTVAVVRVAANLSRFVSVKVEPRTDSSMFTSAILRPVV